MERLTKASPSAQMTERERENREVAYQAACEGMVLLKNDGALPLDVAKTALYGPGASRTVKGGTGSGEVNERRAVTILEGLEALGFEITTRPWLADFEADYAAKREAWLAEKRRRAQLLRPGFILDLLDTSFQPPCGRPITEEDVAHSATDQCIYVLSRQSGEGRDRRPEKGDLLLSDEEEAAIRFCAAHYRRFLLVINTGGPMDMSFTDRIAGINAILYLCQLGSEGGRAFADVVSGRVSPSGRLADTWARRYDDLPFARDYGGLNGELKNEFYREGIYVGYRFFDSFCVEPAFPFGFGLSYTDFSIRCQGISLSEDGRRASVRAEVANTGPVHSGKEVVQLYVSAPGGELDKEYQSLAAFAKTETLAPGARQEVELSFDLANLASYRERDAAFVLEPGEYVLRLGSSSRTTVPVGALMLAEEAVISRHTHVCPLQLPLEELHAPVRAQSPLPAYLPRLTVHPEAFETVVHVYGNLPVCGEERVRRALRRLSAEDMAEIVVGAGRFGGKSRFHLPGAVGNTTSRFWDRGLVNVALCDGPAGLRVQRRSALTRGGAIKPIDLSRSALEILPGPVKKAISGSEDRDTVLYQYTTAFPVASALAQSWNGELLEEVGRALYREMAEYGCTYWLAPAVNIHRNPLCGRNYEYFSEDPRLTGVLAAALTRGVQQEDGFYATVKHFACNNQEENRMAVSSVVGERALREIYLRGFEAVVREGGVKAVMTAYNRVNGVYAPNSHDLCTKVLRCEWGFDGVVMTDWDATGMGRGSSAAAMAAGNDLIMPGSGACKRDILRGIRTGTIAEQDLRRCCGNVIRAVLESAVQREYAP